MIKAEKLSSGTTDLPTVRITFFENVITPKAILREPISRAQKGVIISALTKTPVVFATLFAPKAYAP